MSFFEDASLVLIPSAQKTSKVYSVKPTDGTGDLTFTRSNDTATRVGPDGLIEKVRTNLVLQSNTFNTTWVSAGGSGSTVTSGQADPDGGTSAWLFAKLSQTGRREQAITVAANEQTFSIVAKKGTSNFLYINVFDGTNSHDAYFNLDTGAVGTQSNAVGSIVSVGSGWYRCSVTSTNLNASGIIQLFISDANGVVTGTTGDIYIYQSQFENGVATDYIATTSAAVSVGMLANVPRLDYLGGGCPKLLLEPQRTNALLSSENWTTNWIGANRLVTANDIVSPDGYQNADKLSAVGGGAYYAQSRTTASGANTFSVFLKYGDKTTQSIYAFSSGSYFAQAAFNLQTGTVASTASGTASIEDYGNGWYRCIVSGTAGSSTIEVGIEGIAVGAYTYAWGAQLEAGSYATSYIPTLGAAVTRGTDAASKTGISSLIGQTEGTLFVDFTLNGLADYGTPISVNDGSTNNYVWLTIFANGNLRGELFNGAAQASISYSGAVAGGRYKMAFGYKANDFALYVNGALVGTDLTGTTFSGTTLSRVDTNLTNATSYSIASESINQALLFKTRLTNADLAALTA